MNQFRLEQEQTENVTRQRLSATTRWQDGNGAEPAREEVALPPPVGRRANVDGTGSRGDEDGRDREEGQR